VADAQLDMSIEALTPPPRKSRGAYGFGCGDLAKLFLALGRRPLDSAPRWLRDEVAPMKRMGGESRFLLQKAGRVAKPAQGEAQRGGLDREAELFLAWADEVATDVPGADAGLEIDPYSILYAGALPDEFPPFADKACPRLVARIDAWARTYAGRLVLPSLKCARYGFDRPAWWNGIDRAPWYYEIQCVGEMAVCNASDAVLVIGCGWLRDESDPRDDGPIKALRVERDDALIEEIRDAVREGWSRVEKLVAA
jgi:hypothetical protein